MAPRPQLRQTSRAWTLISKTDAQGNAYPGFRVKILPGKAKVLVLKNGTKDKELDYLEVILADRADVHHSISALTIASQIAQNTMPIGVD